MSANSSRERGQKGKDRERFMSNTTLRAWVAVEQFVRTLRDGERGQGLVEYALILAFVSVLLTVALAGLRNGVSNAFSNGVSAL